MRIPKSATFTNPGLPSHTGARAWSSRQMRGFGGCCGFELGSLRAGRPAAEQRESARSGSIVSAVGAAEFHISLDDGTRLSGGQRQALGSADGLFRISAAARTSTRFERRSHPVRSKLAGVTNSIDLHPSRPTASSSAGAADGSWSTASCFRYRLAKRASSSRRFCRSTRSVPTAALRDRRPRNPVAAGLLFAGGASCFHQRAPRHYTIGRIVGPRVRSTLTTRSARHLLLIGTSEAGRTVFFEDYGRQGGHSSVLALRADCADGFAAISSAGAAELRSHSFCAPTTSLVADAWGLCPCPAWCYATSDREANFSLVTNRHRVRFLLPMWP